MIVEILKSILISVKDVELFLSNYLKMFFHSKRKTMANQIIKRKGNKVTLQVEITLDSESMLNSEEQIQTALNEAGMAASKIALEQFDTDGEAIESADKKLTSKGKVKKNTKAVMGK